MTTESQLIARINKFNNVKTPIRAYVFRNGLDEGFEGKVEFAKEHLLGINASILRGKFDYLLAAVWFNQKEDAKTVDFFGYSGVKQNWKDNPAMDPFIFRNGVFVPRNEKSISDIAPGEKSFCGREERILGKEEDYRLTTNDLREYFEKPPHLGDLEPPMDF